MTVTPFERSHADRGGHRVFFMNLVVLGALGYIMFESRRARRRLDALIAFEKESFNMNAEMFRHVLWDSWSSSGHLSGFPDTEPGSPNNLD